MHRKAAEKIFLSAGYDGFYLYVVGSAAGGGEGGARKQGTKQISALKQATGERIFWLLWPAIIKIWKR